MRLLAGRHAEDADARSRMRASGEVSAGGWQMGQITRPNEKPKKPRRVKKGASSASRLIRMSSLGRAVLKSATAEASHDWSRGGGARPLQMLLTRSPREISYDLDRRRQMRRYRQIACDILLSLRT